MAYKKLIKVSNVCQLLDKSKYPASTTRSGITWTNNGDGTVTANGTCTAEYYVAYILENNLKDKTVIGHKYALFAGNSLATYYPAEFILIFHPRSDGKYFSAANVEHVYGKVGWVLTEGSYSSYSKVELRIRSGATVENFVFKPQLFDLTEMYGAGNEPTTVEQFRQDFPEEMYDYSPRCWLTSYKRVILTGEGNYLTSYQRNLTCKTKNLFDYKTSAEKTQTENGVTLILNADYFELSGQQQAGKYIELGQSGFNIPFEIGKTYVLSADTIVKSGCKVFMQARYTDGENPLTEWETVSWNLSNGTIAKRFTPTRPGYFDKITFYNASDTIPISGYYIIRIQLELGDTATDYVPYGHL